MLTERLACLAAGVALAAAVLLSDLVLRSLETLARFLTGGN
jgi:hypothetical protein